MDIPASFGRWLRLRRKTLDLTQDALARAAGCSVVTIRKLEADERRPSRQVAERLANALQIPTHERASFIGMARAEPAGDLSPAQPPGAAPDRPRSRLPTPLTRLLGRKAELSALRGALLRGDTRLLTLTGLPGVGKTRLALQAAAELRPAFHDGVCFVGLAAVRRPDLVLGAIAQALDVRESGGQPLEARLRAYLQTRRLLLLLDNFEHVLGAAGPLVALLESAPGLKALVTSRAPLHVRGERVVPLAPLPVPAAGAATARAVAQSPAIALFAERARAARPGFAMSDSNAQYVAAICARLDGLPLAIELVAARAGQLSLPDLVTALDRRLALLVGGPRDLPERHQALRAAIDGSYELLGAPTQAIFRRLGVFVGGWTSEAAGAVCADSGLPMLDSAPGAEAIEHPELKIQDVLEGLAILADQSLLRRAHDRDGDSRFSMLETIREYALERLDEAGEHATTARAHAAHYLALAERAAAELHGPRQVAWLATLEDEHPNLRAALEWGLQAGDRESALRLSGALGWFWFVRGHSTEGRRWLARALEGGAAARPELLAPALHAAGHLALFAGDFAAARARLEAAAAIRRSIAERQPDDPAPLQRLAVTLTYLLVTVQYQGDGAARAALLPEYLALYERLKDPHTRALLLFSMGRGLLLQAGEPAAARSYLEQSLALLRSLGDVWTIAQVLIDLGLVALYQDDAEAAGSRYEEALALARTLNDRSLIALALNNLGEVARAAGDDTAADERYAASLWLHEELGNTSEAPRLLHNLGYVALHRGEVDRADALFREGHGRFLQLGMARGVAECLAGLAAVAAASGRAIDAARLWGAAEALHEGEGTPVWPPDRREHARYQALARARLDQASWDAALREGRANPPAQLAALDGAA